MLPGRIASAAKEKVSCRVPEFTVKSKKFFDTIKIEHCRFAAQYVFPYQD